MKYTQRTYIHKTEDSFTQSVSNIAKECLADGLYNDGVIDADLRDKIKEEYIIVLVKKGFFGEMIDKVLGITEEHPVLKLAKVVSRTDVA